MTVPTTDKKPFRSKIPPELQSKVYEWFCAGMSQQAILAKLEQEHAYHTNPRTLQRLLQNVKDERQAQVSAVLAQKTQENALGDYEELTRLYKQVQSVADLAFGTDNNLYLRAVDRLEKLTRLKLGITLETSKDKDQSEDHSHRLLSLAGQ